MGIRRRRSDQSGRAPLRSPGRPPVAGRAKLCGFWLGISRGMTSEDAALAAGLSQPVGTRLFREAGGMAPANLSPSAKPPSGRYLSFAEREEIALYRVQGLSRREIGRRLGRSASTISRELRRNAATRSGGLEYRAGAAQCMLSGAASEAREACALSGPAPLCRGAARRRDLGSGRRCRFRPQRSMEGAPAWTAKEPAMGQRVEPGTDRSPPALGLSE